MCGRYKPSYGTAYDQQRGGYVLTRDGVIVEKRLRQFRKAIWRTAAGAMRAADRLNR